MQFYWGRLTQVSKLADAVDTTLIGIGSLFFCASARSGMCFLAATCALSIQAGACLFLGTLAATAMAMFWYLPRDLIKIGFFSFNGGLIGLYWGFFTVAPGIGDLGEVKSLALMLVAAMLTAPVAKLLFHAMSDTKWNLPILSWPSLVVAWVAFWSLPRLQLLYPSMESIVPRQFDQAFSHSLENLLMLGHIDYGSLGGSMSQMALPVGLLLVGYLLYSPAMAATTGAGMLLGGLYASLIGGWAGLGWVTLIAMTVVPTVTALGGFFTAPTAAAAGLTFVASLLSAGAWYGLSLILIRQELPVFTAGFALTATATLLFLRMLQERNLRKGPASKPAALMPMPLIQIGTVETNRIWYARLQMAQEYWRQLAITAGDSPMFALTRKDLPASLTAATEMLLECKRLVVFTGAGISTESGIPDYRTDFLAWKHYDTRHFLWENFLASEISRQKYWEMSQDFYLIIKQSQPNDAHLALAELEQRGKLKAVITQNVDRLHQRGGVSPTRVIEIHGNELNCNCLQCGAVYNRGEIYQWILNGVRAPYCYKCNGGIIKPASVAFNQPMPLRESHLSLQAAENCDVLMVIGSSLAVQPAALLPWKAKEHGAKVIMINLGGTHFDEHADLIIRERAGVAMRGILDRMREMELYFT